MIFNVSIAAGIDKLTFEALPDASTVNVFKAAPLIAVVIAAPAVPITLFTPRVAAVKAASKFKIGLLVAIVSTTFTVVTFSPRMYATVLLSLTRNRVSTESHFFKSTPPTVAALLSYITTFSIFLRVGNNSVLIVVVALS